jgi:hypothetical protein
MRCLQPSCRSLAAMQLYTVDLQHIRLQPQVAMLLTGTRIRTVMSELASPSKRLSHVC